MPTYGYAPPPPPPPPASGGQQPTYGHAPPSYTSSHGARGGSGRPSGRGRGGHYSNSPSRPDYPPPQYDYAGQSYPGHNPVPPYGTSHPPPTAYATTQPHWTPEQPHAAPQPSHAPAPISSANYHPNYTHQPYQPAQYPQQPPYPPTQQYGQPYQAQPPPPQWTGQGHSQPPTYAGRGTRGAYNGRGRDQAPPPMSSGYALPYAPDPRASYPPPQYQYGAPPPPPLAYPDSGHQGGHFGRGRGGGHRGAGGRGRGGHGAGTRPHNKHGHHDGRNAKHQQHNHKSQQQPQQKQKPDGSNMGKKKKRKTNTLGLTPGMESESEDDEEEEKSLEKLLGQERYQLDDIAQFLAERRRNFPTKARMEAKKAAEQAQKGDDADAALLRERDQLRKQLAKVESSIKRKREPGDEGDEMRGLTLNDSDDDEKPEVMSSRSSAPAAHPPPAKKADVTRHCKYFSTGGTCGKKSKCRFVHDPQVREAAIKEREANNGRLTIQQRLILNDKEQEDLAILQSIQYLRQKGMMKKEAVPVDTDGSPEKDKTPAPMAADPTPKTSSLPPASASLPPPPPKREPVPPRREKPPPSIIPSRDSVDSSGMKHYQGWLLEPYGSSKGKQPRSEDLP